MRWVEARSLGPSSSMISSQAWRTILRCSICEAQLTPPLPHLTVISKCVPHRIGSQTGDGDAETACAMQAIHWIAAQASIPR